MNMNIQAKYNKYEGKLAEANMIGGDPTKINLYKKKLAMYRKMMQQGGVSLEDINTVQNEARNALENLQVTGQVQTEQLASAINNATINFKKVASAYREVSESAVGFANDVKGIVQEKANNMNNGRELDVPPELQAIADNMTVDELINKLLSN